MVEKDQFVYFLKLIPRLCDPSNWAEQDNSVVGRHFRYLEGLLSDGSLILAGRTLDDNPTGIVILEAASQEDAHHLMSLDPAVAEGIMTAELLPYRVSLIRG